MSQLSVPDRAAELQAKRAHVSSLVEHLHARNDARWTVLQLAADEAMGIAHRGMMDAWRMLDRLEQLANMEPNDD